MNWNEVSTYKNFEWRFFVFEKDFEIVSDLAKYIKESNDTTTNDVAVTKN